jgi:hypothetical protein
MPARPLINHPPFPPSHPLSPPIRSGSFPAYQTTNNSFMGITCAVAGDVKNTLMTFYDPTNPAAGAVLTYYGGDRVPGPSGCTISFSIAFQCADFPFPSPVGPYSRMTHFVEQTNDCQYTAYAPSQAGCPQGETERRGTAGETKKSDQPLTLNRPLIFPLLSLAECPIVNGAVCSGKGVCGFDSNSKTSHCFCDDGYQEVDCNTPTSPFPTGAVAGSTIGGILLGLGGIFGYSFLASRRMVGAPGGGVDGFYGQM